VLRSEIRPRDGSIEHLARRAVQLDSRQPSSTEVHMRLIGLAVVLVAGLVSCANRHEAQPGGPG
jgi:hypothetical protein